MDRDIISGSTSPQYKVFFFVQSGNQEVGTLAMGNETSCMERCDCSDENRKVGMKTVAKAGAKHSMAFTGHSTHSSISRVHDHSLFLQTPQDYVRANITATTTAGHISGATKDGDLKNLEKLDHYPQGIEVAGEGNILKEEYLAWQSSGYTEYRHYDLTPSPTEEAVVKGNFDSCQAAPSAAPSAALSAATTFCSSTSTLLESGSGSPSASSTSGFIFRSREFAATRLSEDNDKQLSEFRERTQLDSRWPNEFSHSHCHSRDLRENIQSTHEFNNTRYQQENGFMATGNEHHIRTSGPRTFLQ